MVIKKYTKFAKLWDQSIHLIEAINERKKSEYGNDFMKIKFNSDDDLSFNKLLKLHMLIVIVRYVFEEDGKYYLQVF